MVINVKDIINKPIAISTEDAKKLQKEIVSKIDKGDESIEISFNGVSMLISHFLNVSIGELYTIYSKEKWKVLDSIVYKGINEEDLNLLRNRVIPNYKNTPSDKEKFKNIQEDILK